MTSKTLEEFEALRGKVEAMDAAIDQLMVMSRSEKARMRAEARDKMLWDIAALHRQAERAQAEGEAKGRAEGEAKKQMEIARRLLRMKMSLADIANATGLTEAGIKRLTAK